VSAFPVIEGAALAAARRRDHAHADGCVCVPHCAELIHLGPEAAAVCHDCGFQSPFCDRRAAEQLLNDHCGASRNAQ
jgi:hypothetical protein